MREYLKFYIDGQWVEPAEGVKTLDVINPATEEVCGKIAMGSAADVDKAVKAMELGAHYLVTAWASFAPGKVFSSKPPEAGVQFCTPRSLMMVSNVIHEQEAITGGKVDWQSDFMREVALPEAVEDLPKLGFFPGSTLGNFSQSEAVEFLRAANHFIHTQCPGVVTIAEESTSWPQVTRPPYLGGLGFTFKWYMGWMLDTLYYFKRVTMYS